MQLSEEQLKNVQELQNQFSGTKLQLADLVYKQSLLIKKLDELKDQFTTLEQSLIEEFGQDSVIDLKTGIVKTKEEVEKEDAEKAANQEAIKEIKKV